MAIIDIEGLDKAEVLHALYHRSHVQGLGILQAIPAYTVADARRDLDEQPGYYFDRHQPKLPRHLLLIKGLARLLGHP